MQEFPYIEYLKQQGAREMSIKNTLSILTVRFPNSDVQPVAEALESIEDLDHLSDLHLMSIDIPSVAAFLQALNGSEV